MNLLTRLHILPPPDRRFGFWRTVLLYLLAVIVMLVLSNTALSGMIGGDLLRNVVSLLLALPSLLVPLLWNRSAVKAGAPGFLAVWASRIRAIASVAFVFGTALALILAVENRRAASAWKALETDLKSRGEPLRFTDLAGPPIPPEQNFAEHPLMAGILSYTETNDARGLPTFRWTWTGQKKQRELSDALRFPEIPTPETKEGKKLRRTGPDLVALSEVLKTGTNMYRTSVTDPVTGDSSLTNKLFNLPIPPPDMAPAQAVLFVLEAKRPLFDQIAEAARRPGSRFDIRYDDGPNALLPHLALHKAMAVQLRTRIAARIGTGDAKGAMEDIDTILRLAEKLDGDPTMISYLVRVAVQTIAVSGFWEGATAHAWSDAQLAEFQRRFDGIRQRDPLVRAFRGERLFGKTAFEMLREGRLDYGMLAGNDGESDPRVGMVRLFPSSWLLQNQIHHTRLLDGVTSILLKADPERCVASAEVGRGMNDLEDAFFVGKGKGFMPYRILADMLTPALARTHVKADRMLTVTRLASAAAALERHRLATGSYPKALAELAPRFAATVPTDPMTGQPFGYRLEGDGTFTLYGMGPNKKDDNGVFEAKSGGGDLDWVWPPARLTEERRLF
jgi:hypothetical protein